MSSLKEIYVDIDALADGEDLSFTLKRSKFEELCKYLFDKIISLIEKVLKDSSLYIKDIYEIILTGGTTKIPRIQEIIQAFFNGKELNKSINLEEVYAYGAAVVSFSKIEIEQMNKFKIENYNKLLEEIEKLKIENNDLKKLFH